jgi:hypothetical protein
LGVEELCIQKAFERAGIPVGDWSVPAFGKARAVTKIQFIAWLRRKLKDIVPDVSEYAGHSLRRGGASSLARSEVPVYVLKILGRWKSDCFREYIDISMGQLKSLTLQMCSQRNLTGDGNDCVREALPWDMCSGPGL